MRNEKGEDWGKFMGEMNDLQPLLRQEMADMGQPGDYKPILNKDGTPMNDPTVRQRKKGEVLNKDGAVAGKKDKFAIIGKDGTMLSSTAKIRKKKVEEIKDNLDKYASHIQAIINDWIGTEFEKVLTDVEWRALQEGNRWPIKKRGMFIDIQHEKMPPPFGSDIVTLYVKKKIVAQQKFVWEFEE